MATRENSNLELRVAEESVIARARASDTARFPGWLLILAKRKSFIIKAVVGAAVAAVVLSFLMHDTYTGETKIMPPQQNQSMSNTAILSQLGPMAALAGQTLGLRNASDLYVSMLRSDSIADKIIDRFSLMSLYHAKTLLDARKRLAGATLIVAGKDGVITVDVEDAQSYRFSRSSAVNISKQRAADIANAYVEELENLTKTLAVTEAGKRRAFFERETKMALDDLSQAEQALKETQEKTGLILLEPQSRAMLEALSSLRARVSAQEVLVQSMQSFAAPQNPELLRAQQELAALKEQIIRLERGQGRASIADVPIENVPTAGLEYLRKLREVKYREALFELLAKQYEAAKIDEARDSVIIQQLDKALRPERKSGPQRSLIVLCTIVLASLIAGLLAFLLEKLEQAKEDPHFAHQFQLFKFYIRRAKP